MKYAGMTIRNSNLQTMLAINTNKIFIILLFTFYYSANAQLKSAADMVLINSTLDNWHQAASLANFDLYFSYMAKKAVFIGTDPTENWHNEAFKTFSKPFFDKGKAWSFKSIQRNIYFSDDRKTAWFDELLSTQMKICRGSGVLLKQKDKWKIAHYVLSISIPNEFTDKTVKIKTAFDDNLINKLKQ